MADFSDVKESLADEFLNIAAASLVRGYGAASTEAGVKVLSLIICSTGGIPKDKRKSLEEDLNWLVKTRIEEIKRKA